MKQLLAESRGPQYLNERELARPLLTAVAHNTHSGTVIKKGILGPISLEEVGEWGHSISFFYTTSEEVQVRLSFEFFLSGLLGSLNRGGMQREVSFFFSGS